VLGESRGILMDINEGLLPYSEFTPNWSTDYWNGKRKKLNMIIRSLAHSAEYAENSASLKRIVKRLEEFRDEEL
jgi:hypothetical protein